MSSTVIEETEQESQRWGMTEEELASYPTVYREGLLDGKVVVISGGGSGMGQLACRNFAAAGAAVAALDVSDQGLARTAEGIDNINLDTDLWFKLRGHSFNNPLIDACIPLFGLVLRLRNLTENNDVENLYNRIKTDMAALEEEVRRHEYDRATQIAFHYCLCTFID